MKRKFSDVFDWSDLAFLVGAFFFMWMLVARPAEATGDRGAPPPVDDPTVTQTANPIADARADATADASATAASDAVSDVSGDFSSGNSQSVQFKSPSTIKNTASGIAPAIFGSNPCVVGGSIGIGVPGFNGGFGKGKIDPQCELRETARIMIASGEQELGMMLLCATTAAVSVFPEGVCGSSLDTQGRVIELEGRIETLLAEREIDRQECNASKDRLTENCIDEVSNYE